MTDNEIRDAKLAVLYKLRLIFEKSDKKEYKSEEICDLLDELALKDCPDSVKKLIKQ